ncbi:MAG: phosphatidylinositol kinase [Streptosporangiales bacterium]|nr:phosphatidylinositol kinase [Streptosporangiales bacterium]
MDDRVILRMDEALRLLRDGDIEVVGRIVQASNATLFCSIEVDGISASCVYKPIAGERPLWDFPEGTLAGREVAAFLVSEATGWHIVPPTVYRDGPFGPGMCQLWIDVDETADILALARSQDPGLRRMAVFDAVVNNADRKGGHLLPTCGGHVYGVDHGVCFSVDDKLRTVLWQWRGRRLPDDVVPPLRQLDEDLADGGRLAEALDGLLTGEEVAVTRERVSRLLRTGVFPDPPDDWPAVPWPPI